MFKRKKTVIKLHLLKNGEQRIDFNGKKTEIKAAIAGIVSLIIGKNILSVNDVVLAFKVGIEDAGSSVKEKSKEK